MCAVAAPEPPPQLPLSRRPIDRSRMPNPQPSTTPQSDLRVRLSEDRMLAELIVPARFPTELLTRGSCAAAFAEKGVLVKDPQLEMIERQIGDVRREPGRKHTIKLEGLSARHGLDGYIEFERRFITTADRPKTTEHAVDYYAQSRYININEGDVIARLVPPTRGTDGIDVTGESRKARPGHPAPINIHPSITVEDDGECVANVAGVLYHEDHVLKVLQNLEIRTDVAFRTGNIDVRANVEVFGSVIDRFAVSTPHSLVVHKLTEGADIHTGEDFHARGGMAGKLKGHLDIGRDLNARYLDNVVGVVHGSAAIEREIVNTALDIDGELNMPHGTLVGSAIYVMKKVTLRELGSDGSERTVLALGTSPKTETLIERTDAALLEMTEQIEPIRAELEMLTGASAGRIESERDRLAQLRAIQAGLVERCQRIEGKRDALRDRLHTSRRVHLSVERTIHPGVHLIIDGFAYRFDSAVRGPLTIALDEANEPILRDGRDGSTADLTRIARRIEAPKRGPTPRCLDEDNTPDRND